MSTRERKKDRYESSFKHLIALPIFPAMIFLTRNNQQRIFKKIAKIKGEKVVRCQIMSKAFASLKCSSIQK